MHCYTKAINHQILYFRRMKTNINFFKGKTTNTLVQLFRYLWVGGISFIIDYISLFIFTEYLHINYLISAAIAFILGLTTNYQLSTIWVFNNSRLNNKFTEFTIFSIIGIIGLGLNEVIIYICSEYLNLYYMISKLISTAVVFFWNFMGRKYILFTNYNSRQNK